MVRGAALANVLKAQVCRWREDATVVGVVDVGSLQLWHVVHIRVSTKCPQRNVSSLMCSSFGHGGIVQIAVRTNRSPVDSPELRLMRISMRARRLRRLVIRR